MAKWVEDIINDVAGGAVQMLQDTCDNTRNILSLSTTNASSDATTIIKAMNTVTTTLTNAMQDTILPGLISVGYAIALFFFILSMIELINQDRLTIEMFVKFFGKLAIGVFFVWYSKDIFVNLVALGDGLSETISTLFEKVGQNLGTHTKMTEAFHKLAEKPDGIFEELGLVVSVFVTMFPCYLIAFVVQLLSYIIAFTRLIELYARGAMLPIACALMTDDGWRGTGGSYIKKFIAISCQSAILVAIAGIASVAFTTIATSVFDTMATNTDLTTSALASGVGIMCAVGISMVSVMFKSIGIVNDAFGAR